jgi:uncharacterized protein (TIGR02246 family)
MWKSRRKSLAVASLLALAVCPGSGQEAKKESPERVVQDQVEAYNRHDLDSFLGFYSPDVKLYDFPGKEVSSGLDAMRKTYGKLFADNPELKVDIVKRIVQGDTVIDQEAVSVTSRRRFTAVAIYRVKEGKIAGVWFVR